MLQMKNTETEIKTK